MVFGGKGCKYFVFLSETIFKSMVFQMQRNCKFHTCFMKEKISYLVELSLCHQLSGAAGRFMNYKQTVEMFMYLAII